MSILDINRKIVIDNSIVDAEYHSHQASTTNFNHNDEMRISIEGERPTLPSLSYLEIKGKVTKEDGTKSSDVMKLVNNGLAHIFSEIRYELNGITIDSTTKVGVTSTIKGVCSFSPNQVRRLQSAGWIPEGAEKKFPMTDDHEFTINLPLSTLLGFAEDYKKVILNIRQELVLIRSSSDYNALYHATEKGKITIDRILWKVPHIVPSLKNELILSDYIKKQTDIHIAFRTWELHSRAGLPVSNRHSWNIKSVRKSQSPLYVILAFQTGRDGNMSKDTGNFDKGGFQSIRVFLNSVKRPYDTMDVNLVTYRPGPIYDMYANFQRSYYDKEPEPLAMFEKFCSAYPFVVVDCSKQPENIAFQTQSVNVRVEFDTNGNISADTTVYCLLIYEKHFTYNPLTKYVNQL